MGSSGLRWTAEELPALRGYGAEWMDPERLILSRRDRLYLVDSEAARPDGASRHGTGGKVIRADPGHGPAPSERSPYKEGPGQASGPSAEPMAFLHARDLPLPPMLLARFPSPWWKRLVAASRAGQRLLRFLYYNVVRLPDGALFVTFDREAGMVREGRVERIRGLVRPSRVLRGAVAAGRDGALFFGEYSMNPDRGEVFVYRLDPRDGRAEVAMTFPADGVRHVHGIYADPFDDALWCLTGDVEDECRMLRTRDGFRTVDVVGAGDESWRTVSVQFTRDAIVYATDAEFRRNVLYRLDRRTGERAALAEIDGPVYYSTAAGEDLFFAVTAELCPSQTSRHATLWNVDAASNCAPVAAYPKDRLPVRFFLPGTLQFPAGPRPASETLFHAVGLAGADHRTFRVRRADR